MKGNNLKKLALLGLSTGMLAVSGVANAADKSDSSPNEYTDEDPNDGNLNYHLLTEDELLIELSPEGAAMYNSLDEEGKELAREVASSRCNGTNKCAGLNACRTQKNSCAGKGACQGKSKCGISDKNLAVKLVRDKMAKKRENAIQAK